MEKIVRMIISVDIKTNSDIDKITMALTRGIYRGLDTEPVYVAPPKDVTINFIHEVKTKHNEN